jgi:hypothetical protein
MKMRSSFALVLTILAFSISRAQNPFPELAPVFQDDIIPRVDIFLPPDSLAVILAPGNEESNYHFHATFVFDNGLEKDTLENIGFRLRGNTSRYAKKKSFKVSFNTYEPGRKWEGLEKLNLNGEHNDPAVARAKVCWDMARWLGVPAPRANHVELYINGDYFGLYINVEHIDEEFVQLRYGNNDGNLYKCLYPADLDYKGSNPNLYKEVYYGRRAYELITNTDLDDYSDLAYFIDVLNNTPMQDLPCELEQVFEVDTYLKAIALDILTANWDGPIFNKNNFYLYHNLASGKFEYIPYDLDNTFGIDWFGIDWASRNIYNWEHPSEPRPIYERILAVPAYRDRFSYYLDQGLEAFFSEAFLFPYLDDLRDLIAPSAQADPYRPLDYGFSYNQFLSSFQGSLPFYHTPIGIKPFIQQRRAAALGQLDLNDIAPILTQVQNNLPNALQDISVTVRAVDDGGLGSVELCYRVDGQSFTCIPMYDDGDHADGGPGDGLFGSVIPPLNQPALLEYYVRATDDAAQQSIQPVCGYRSIQIGDAAVLLVINEFMASNSATYPDEAGQYDDWIEIFSLSDVPIYLGNYYLSDNPSIPDKWPMPDIWIQPETYLIFWADDDLDQGVYHTNFKLSADGEFIGIFGENLALIDGVEFGLQQTDVSLARIPNGTGPFQPGTPTPGAENQALSHTKDHERAEHAVRLFPNPTSGGFYLEWDEKHQDVAVRIYNSFGQLIHQRTASGTESLFLDLESAPAGLYWVDIHFPDRRVLHRLILQH